MEAIGGDDEWDYDVREHTTIDGDVSLLEPLTPWPWGDEDGKEPVEDSEGLFTKCVTRLTHLYPNL